MGKHCLRSMRQRDIVQILLERCFHLLLIRVSFLFENGDYIFIPNIVQAIKDKAVSMKAFVVNKDMKEIELKMDELTDDEKTDYS